jgi:hypothetical protein
LDDPPSHVLHLKESRIVIDTVIAAMDLLSGDDENAIIALFQEAIRLKEQAFGIGNQ